MAEELLETVDRLQSRLMESPEPRKLLKTLKRLDEVPMTVEILVETGVGKTVNSFRKHEVAAEVARNLVAKWKKLVPQSADNRSGNSLVKEAPRSHSRGAEAAVRRRRRQPSPEEEEPSYGQDDEEEEEEERGEEEEEERGYRTDGSPSPPLHRRYSPPRSDRFDSPEPEPEPSPPPPRLPAVPRKDSKHGKLDRADKNRRRHADLPPSSRADGKKRSADRERGPAAKSAKRDRKSDGSKREEARKEEEGRPQEQKDWPGSEEDREEDFETPTMSFESFLTYDAPTSSVKKKKKKNAAAPSSSCSRPSRPSATTTTPTTTTTTTSRRAARTDASSKANGAQSAKSSRSGSAAAAPERRKRATEAVASLPEMRLPAIQPDYRPLPSIDVTPLSPQRRKGPVFSDEDDAGFTGKRFNSKMVVYSGSKTAYLPRMMTLYEQCIRVLQNNIDSIDEVGGVPFEILEPVLERCTPEQLYRIEQSNQWFTEDSDELWMRHCQRDFKRETPQEYESWREMYLRLHDEREARLRRLTQNISMAHANKPKERQVKMAFVNSVAKPPRDVRRRQEKFGTTNGSSAAAAAAATPVKIRPATVDYSGESGHPSLSSSPLDPSPGSSRSSAAVAGGHAWRDKPQVKKIAPMMAKTIKAFKNRFSRR
ncbi:elongin-A [Syngnathoides biaculeatus]|uniref:elongin-A n=1 Tax=Syngnathoides biaculeatus TaxID=300417 RepID=UPI002ADDABE8|nr:elongin-A [Syngnathoides biaculeatus]